MHTNAKSASSTSSETKTRHEEKLEILEKNQTPIQTRVIEIKGESQATQNLVLELIKEKGRLQTSLRMCDRSPLRSPCSQQPQQINHPIDLKHPLSLLPRPAYSSGIFVCNACGRNGDGFSYHCALCRIDIHAQCVATPLSLASSAHRHPLALAFSRRPNSIRRGCNICDHEVGPKYWRYRYNECDFDAHLYRAREEEKQEQQAPARRMNDSPSAQQPSDGEGMLPSRSSRGSFRVRLRRWAMI